MPRDDQRTDDELIQAINGGDERAFEVLYERYRDWAGGLARRFTRSDADAMDVLQETFAYLLRKRPRLQLTAKMTTFLYPVIRNAALTLRRKRMPEMLDADLLCDLSAPPAQPDSELHRIVQQLPAGQRDVLLMRFVDDMTLEEIATALATPVGTVKSRLHNALRTLRQDPRTAAHFD